MTENQLYTIFNNILQQKSNTLQSNEIFSMVSLITLMQIVDIFNLKYNDLLSKNKEEPYATYRKIAMYILYVNLPVSQPQLSKFFGKKHHSAVTYAIRTTKEWMIHNREFRQKIDTIQNKLNKLENQNQ